MDKNKKLFPQRLWELIHDEKYNFCLRWSPDGQRVYLNRNDFETHYLKTPNNQFHTQKAISFVRQMNMYGFKKVDDCYYENDNFKKNCHHLLKNMVRRNSNKNGSTINDSMTMNADSNDMEQQHSDNHQMLVDAAGHQTMAHLNEIQTQQQHNQQEQLRTSALIHNNQHQQQSVNSHRQQLNPFQILNQPQQRGLQHSAQTLIGNQDINLAANNSPIGRDNSAALLEAISAVMAAFGGCANAAQLPLASTLYHRLAALSFVNNDNTSSSPNEHQHNLNSNGVSSDDSLTFPVINQTNMFSSLPRIQSGAEFNVSDIPMSPQNSLAARQALQQTLLTSLLHLHQSQQPLNMDQNFSTSIQRQLSPNVTGIQHHSPITRPDIGSTLNNHTPLGMSPMELVAQNQAIAEDNNYQHQQLLRLAHQVCNQTNISIQSNGHMNESTKNNFTMGDSNMITNMNPQAGLVGKLKRDLRASRSDLDREHDFEDDDDDNGESNGSRTNSDGMLFKRPSNNSMGNSSSSSSNYAQDVDDGNDTALDLAKSSKERSGIGQKMSS